MFNRIQAPAIIALRRFSADHEGSVMPLFVLSLIPVLALIGTAVDYVRAANSHDAPSPAPYPVQFDLTAAMRQTGLDTKDIHRMQLWAGQSAGFARRESAAEFVRRTWVQAQALLPCQNQ